MYARISPIMTIRSTACSCSLSERPRSLAFSALNQFTGSFDGEPIDVGKRKVRTKVPRNSENWLVRVPASSDADHPNSIYDGIYLLETLT